ncbi:AAA family ATPase [Enterobacter sp. H2G27]
MKIAAIYTQSVGPLRNAEISFKNDWTGEIEENVLLTGPNGCGKSTLLRGIAMLWDALGYWLDQRDFMPLRMEPKKWLRRWDGVAIVLEDMEFLGDEKVGVYFGNKEWVEELIIEHPDISWAGETFGSRSTRINLSKGVWSTGTGHSSLAPYLVDKWSQIRQRLLITSEYVDAPNIIYLDADERRWVSPQKNISSLSQDDLSQRWLATYSPSTDWKDQLEASLFNMKATLPDQYPEMMRTLNQFFSGKVIEEDIQPGQRQQVKLANGETHTLDELSSGEHQVLIMLFMVQRWLQPGGVVLIDEPDLHLHPSLVPPLLATLENIIQKKRGQLILTSHATDVWERYENLGIRTDLSRLKEVHHGKD